MGSSALTLEVSGFSNKLDYIFVGFLITAFKYERYLEEIF